MYRCFVSLGRYTAKYFILFVAMVNGIVSLISLSVFSLLVYRNEEWKKKIKKYKIVNKENGPKKKKKRKKNIFMKHIKIVSNYFTINLLKYFYKETASWKRTIKNFSLGYGEI